LRAAGIPLLVQDARDYHGLSHLLGKVNPQVIIHLAAVAHANRSNKDPYSTFDHSLRTLENALDAARSKGSPVQHFVYFSSSMVYGHFNGQAVSEDTHCEPLGIYGALKFAGEKMVIAYNQVFDLPYTIIRPSALYGERCISRRVIQIFIENAVMGKDITINGDGSDALDFTYIGDLVNGIGKVLTSNRSKNEIFNLTYGSARSLAEIAELLQAEFPKLKVNYNPKDNLTPDRGTLKVDKAREMIGYEPQYPIDVAVPKYVDWYKQLLST
ncbi:MAG: NAD(P)-dependent oxidoreductase, partial [Acetobacterales bacterium]